MNRTLQVAVVLASLSVIIPLGAHERSYDLTFEPHWTVLEAPRSAHGGVLSVDEEWVLAGIVTLRNRPQKTITLTSLTFVWQGQSLTAPVFGSLFEKRPGLKFSPVQENLVSDGKWQQSGQRLVFNFDQPCTVREATKFYLVLAVPVGMRALLRVGGWEVDPRSLPKEFRRAAYAKPAKRA